MLSSSDSIPEWEVIPRPMSSFFLCEWFILDGGELIIFGIPFFDGKKKWKKRKEVFILPKCLVISPSVLVLYIVHPLAGVPGVTLWLGNSQGPGLPLVEVPVVTPGWEFLGLPPSDGELLRFPSGESFWDFPLVGNSRGSQLMGVPRVPPSGRSWDSHLVGVPGILP